MRFDTRLVHVGQDPTPGTGDVVPPIHIASTYERRVQEPPRYFYSRGENPTREGLESCLAALEDARFATVFPSGQAAAATLLSLLAPGQRLVCSREVYGGTYSLFTYAARYGVEVVYADLTDAGELDRRLDGDVAMVWIETPTNPLLQVVDIMEVRRRDRNRNALVVVDNTFASPALQEPLRLGADISLYSTTKFVAGHSDVVGGALVYDDEDLDRRIRDYRVAAGNVPGAMDCFLVHRGLKTLSLRVARQVETARAVAEMLRAAPSVGKVYYPGLPDHPQYDVACRQMTAPGGVVSFEYLGPPDELLARVRLFSCAVSLGGVRSLMEFPALMTHRTVPRETLAELGITDSLVRLSLGIEDPRDLVDDLRFALG